MSDSYAKLFSSIVTSTVWLEPKGTRLVWITMLALKRRDGCVYASVPGLADQAKVSRAECEEALRTFLAPDPDSRTKEHEGRRIEEIDGGWLILNAKKFDAIRSAEERREYKRLWQYNKRHSGVVDSNVDNVVQKDPNSSSSNTNSISKSKDQKKEHTRAKRASLTPLPEDFGVSERVKEWAERNDFARLDEHLEHFTTTAKARAYVYADWDAAFMTAIRKDWAGLRVPGQSQVVRPAMGKTANAISKLQGMKNGNERLDLEPDATLAMPRIGGPARG